MADMQSLLDKLHYDGTQKYSRTVGNVDYLDARKLARPASMPRTQRIIAAVIVVAAIVVGFVILNNTVISQVRAAATAEQTLSDNLAREASISTIPQMDEVINMNDGQIMGAFLSAGLEIYDASEMYDSNDMTLYKIPSDMTSAEAASLYLKGINALNVEQATKLLNGSWYFATDRVNTTSMVVRYADFSTGDPDIAIQNALRKQGFDASSITESGVDEADNTYSSGTVEADGTSCTWKISALNLADMYSISGLPEDACYVGIRITAN